MRNRDRLPDLLTYLATRPDGATPRSIDSHGLTASSPWTKAVSRALATGLIETCDVPVPGRKASYPGYKLTAAGLAEAGKLEGVAAA